MATDKAVYVKRYDYLRYLRREGKITDLIVSPKWSIQVDGVHICVVEADFAYCDVQRGTSVAEFINPTNSAVHGMKKKLLRACHAITAEDVRG